MFRDLIGVPNFDPAEAQNATDDPLFVRAAARAISVLTAFEAARKPLTLEEIAVLSSLDRSAAQRMVHTLMSLGMIVRDREGRGYLPGKRVLTMAHSALRLDPVCQRATPVLLELRRRTRERVDMSFWDDTRLIYALRMPSKHEIFTATLTGNTVPVYCTAGGIAILAHLGDDEIADIVSRSDLMPFTSATVTTLAEVMTAVTAARARGHARMVGQLLRHEIALGAAVLDAARRPIGAVHVAGTLEEWTEEAFSSEFGGLLETAVTTIRG
ncbi:IclR family transcriptional regulator [Haematobacter massiliensis]|uniref:IclR family transcriptional regulator n=1 Tax=Haematobacter massiliensis TaxID=195105 RepID=A0A086Y4Z7_9RHOB|nr:IclR family transcriptional regulator [Haematobacter massiliensis]KFI29347.1 IclR family transcriptional regulator [Haematobacter massiliensis]OWJ71158.1 IclR family transcriptional regulator [Haematobacter massiliensis]OWJ84304.1 IclR family transcriptional regulator [Haematobacter massiliensis]QBJ25964.1 IclR family transcriptional regulator [Haematobacter massiliensis]